MTGRDRTAEFLATIKSKTEKPQWIQQRQEANGYDNQIARKPPIDPQYRQFMRNASSCSRKIRNSYENLEKLTILAREKTVLDERVFNNLIAEIQKDIRDSKNQLDELQVQFKPKQKHSENAVTTLQQRLANVTSHFKSTLENRSRSVQQQTARQDLFGVNPNMSLVQSQETYNNRNGPLLIDMNSGVAQQYPHEMMQQQQQSQMLMMNDPIVDRADVMHTIESTIVELGTVFNQLANMVQAQGETITRIDMNISETTGNVEAAHEALLSYFASINTNRWLILKVFMVLFLFFMGFVIFAT